MDAKKYIEIDPNLLRPNEVHDLLGDPAKIGDKLGWHPRTSFDELVTEMVAHDQSTVKGRF